MTFHILIAERWMRTQPAEYESNANNDPEHDTDHVPNETNTMREERSEDGGTVEHAKE